MLLHAFRNNDQWPTAILKQKCVTLVRPQHQLFVAYLQGDCDGTTTMQSVTILMVTKLTYNNYLWLTVSFCLSNCTL